MEKKIQEKLLKDYNFEISKGWFVASLCIDEPENPEIYDLVTKNRKKVSSKWFKVKSIDDKILTFKIYDVIQSVYISNHKNMFTGKKLDMQFADYAYEESGKIRFECKEDNKFYYIDFDLRGDSENDCESQFFEFIFYLVE